MAYAAMNLNVGDVVRLAPFLNGVCRHEPCFNVVTKLLDFLNGVCRHERGFHLHQTSYRFLNGVCRHEPSVRISRIL